MYVWRALCVILLVFSFTGVVFPTENLGVS